ncbi:hypothetical protein VSH64_12430 [Amycolatopsis rhabdoformis]|uniref:Sigma-70 family RNA polymerase sigma factor n=1 Tax=Amycolatopsis rhabdoformis TaxID=1448059 RepID=A0ABZ1IGW7_9PSEU|nr:hypothetical protein [Amycolatopsis rhabdoformis]WSE32913.1 hypothetical protein VSH64_12430 [Amycolatopsis rhabdoformis]
MTSAVAVLPSWLRARPAQAPGWVRAPWPAEDDRSLTLAFRVARGAGLSRRAAARLCRRLVREGQLAAGRDRLLAALSATLRPRVAEDRLAKATADALLLDAFQTLPHGRRGLLWSALREQRSAAELAAESGLPAQRVHEQLRDALRELSAGRPA